MRNKILHFVVSGLLSATPTVAIAQLATASDNLVANKITDGVLPFAVSAEGEQLPVIWGMDTAWPDEGNMKRGIAFIGKENLGTARGSFQPSDLIVDGQLSTSQKSMLNRRLNLIKLSGVTNIALNCDHEVLCNTDNYPNAAQNAANYKGKPEEWVKLFKATVEYCRSKGFNVVSIAPFNEPDFTNWNQGTKNDFLNIIKLMKADSFFDGIRICGGNTLNCDQALSWYNHLKDYLDEGNTHQLAGVFDTYAGFFSQVKKDGKHGTADELHNVMEAMVGVEYGMQTGIWWGFDGLARGEFCRASFGDRLAYAEDRTHWSAASVYRNNKENKIQAFLGTSERQANNSSYRFISTERDVFYDGQGPLREFVMDMPGGTGYQVGQTNAERVINITWGEDVSPYINGEYMLINASSGKALSLYGANASAGSSIVQKTAIGAAYQLWNVKPADSRIGGDFSYYTIVSTSSKGYTMDVLNWALNASDIIAYGPAFGANQQWYLQYAGNGFFYIRSRHSSLCLEVQNGTNTENAKIRQNTLTPGSKKQMWRFVPAGVKSEFEAPVAPTGLASTSRSASILLEWNANVEEDIESYTIVRAEAVAEGEPEYNTIGRGITGTAFLDNSAAQGVKYLYKIKAVDKAGNTSESSETIEATTNSEKTMIAQYQFDNDLTDMSDNMFNSASMSKMLYTASHKSGEKAAMFSSANNFVQLPYQVANMKEMTISVWVNMRASTAWQRIFDFGNGTDQYMYLTPNSGTDMRFVMRNKGEEEILSAPKLSISRWLHVTLSISDEAVVLYVDGEEVARSTEMTIRPSDIKPVMNYIGRSQFKKDPMIKAYMDDLRIYNYALDQTEIKEIVEIANDIKSVTDGVAEAISTEYYSVDGSRLTSPQRGVNIVRTRYANGKVSVKKVLNQ